MIELTPEQQAKEDARLAKELLENPIFQRVTGEYIGRFTDLILNLEPEDKDAFPIAAGARKYLIAIVNQINAIANTEQSETPGAIIQ